MSVRTVSYNLYKSSDGENWTLFKENISNPLVFNDTEGGNVYYGIGNDESNIKAIETPVYVYKAEDQQSFDSWDQSSIETKLYANINFIISDATNQSIQFQRSLDGETWDDIIRENGSVSGQQRLNYSPSMFADNDGLVENSNIRFRGRFFNMSVSDKAYASNWFSLNNYIIEFLGDTLVVNNTPYKTANKIGQAYIGIKYSDSLEIQTKYTVIVNNVETEVISNILNTTDYTIPAPSIPSNAIYKGYLHQTILNTKVKKIDNVTFSLGEYPIFGCLENLTSTLFYFVNTTLRVQFSTTPCGDNSVDLFYINSSGTNYVTENKPITLNGFIVAGVNNKCCQDECCDAGLFWSIGSSITKERIDYKDDEYTAFLKNDLFYNVGWATKSSIAVSNTPYTIPNKTERVYPSLTNKNLTFYTNLIYTLNNTYNKFSSLVAITSNVAYKKLLKLTFYKCMQTSITFNMQCDRNPSMIDYTATLSVIINNNNYKLNETITSNSSLPYGKTGSWSIDLPVGVFNINLLVTVSPSQDPSAVFDNIYFGFISD